MDELVLNEELFKNLISWMQSKYAFNTIKTRGVFLKKIFKNYGILNKETLKRMMKGFKYQSHRAAITMINDYCYDNNIDFSIRVPSVKAQANKLPEILSPEEIRIIIESAPKPYDLVIRCIFNMGAGLRVSEIIKMSWNHIRWIDWISNKESYGVAQIKSGKGMKDRIVNIPKNLMSDLYDYAKSKEVLNEFGIPQGGMIFTFGYLDKENGKVPRYQRKLQKLMGEDLERWKEDYIKTRYDWFRYNIIEKYCEKALGKRIKIHSLRHSKSTYLYEIEHVPIEKIQLLLGHKSMNTTMIYTRINPRSVFEMLKETKEI